MTEESKELTVLHNIVSNFKKYPWKTAFAWLDKNCEIVSSISYKELGLVTEDIATELLKVTSEGNYSSKTVVLCYTPGPEFITAFLGCLRAGLIPVPVKSPDTTELYYKKNLGDIVKGCGASFILSNQHLFKGQDVAKTVTLTSLMKATGLEWFAVSSDAAATNVIPEEEEDQEEELQTAATQDLDQAAAAVAVELDRVKAGDVAFLQFTTTEKPKGVMVTYKNLQHNFKLMDSCYGTSFYTTELCLLPHFNGFALVGSYLHILHTGASAFFISPQDFYQRPASWIEATSKFQLSHAKIPSCAFIESIYVYLKDIDLSSLKCIACLEPILPEDITTFEQCMVQNFNLKKNIVTVSYGLAEHVAIVCSSSIHNRERRIAIKNRSSCGKPAPDVTVKIVHPTEGFEMIEGDVGEIWVSSPSNAVGYYTDRHSTKEAFHARLHSKLDRNHYLRTADLGFMANGELFVVETMSEVMNLEGRTVYPIDIESSIESILPSLSHCKSIVSNNPIHPDNQLLFIAELRSPSYSKRSYDNFKREVLTHIYHEFKLSVGTVVFFSPFSIPCTTFGKRQRSLSYKLCLTTDAQIYKWTKPKGSEDMPTILMPSSDNKLSLSPVREDEQPSPTPPQDSTLRPSLDSQSTSPIHEGRLSPLPDDKSSSGRTRRVSAPAMPLSQTPPKVPIPRLKRAKSGDFLGRSGITLILHIAAKTMGHTVSPTDMIWEEGSPLVEEMSVMLKEKCGFNIDYGTMLLAQSPEALLAVMKMSLLSSEPVIKRHKPFRLSFSTTPPPIFESAGTSYHSNNDIAIVGVGGIFAECQDVEELWKMMAHNHSAITTRQNSSGGKKYTGCFSRFLTQLDNTQYGLEESEIASLDPHQMMLLHCTRECIKSAGFAVDLKKNHSADWGVFAGVSPSSNQAANCISRAFNLTGPTIAINSERNSLSALSVACLHLKLKQCSAAIVCGARAILSPSDLPTSSDTTFPPGEGCAAILLMSVGLARKFNRRILAVVKGTASNCDNPSSQRSQTGLLKHAFQEAGLTTKDISFVEADLRGTKQEGTAHLDSIQNAFLPEEEEEGGSGASTAVGCVKVNIGDLGAASGVAGLLRTVMALEHARLPGSARQDVPKPTTSHSKVETFPKEATDLSSQGKPLAGVMTSFGITGCNEAAVIQEYSILPHMAGVSSWLILGADHMIGDRFWLLSEAARKSSCYAEIFGSLKTQFPLIQNALVHFNQTFQLACDKYRFKPHQKIAANFNVAVLKLYYGIFTQLSASGMNISVLGGTNATNEVVALLFAGSIDLSTAIFFMCCKSLQRGRESVQNQHSEQFSQDPVGKPTLLGRSNHKSTTHLGTSQKHSPALHQNKFNQSDVAPAQRPSRDPFPFQKTVRLHKRSQSGQQHGQQLEKKFSQSDDALVQKLTHQDQQSTQKLSRSDEDLVQNLTYPGQVPKKKLSSSEEELVQELTYPGQRPELKLSHSEEDLVQKLTYPGQQKVSQSDEVLVQKLTHQGQEHVQKPSHTDQDAVRKPTLQHQNPSLQKTVRVLPFPGHDSQSGDSAQKQVHSPPKLKQQLLTKKLSYPKVEKVSQDVQTPTLSGRDSSVKTSQQSEDTTRKPPYSLPELKHKQPHSAKHSDPKPEQDSAQKDRNVSKKHAHQGEDSVQQHVQQKLKQPHSTKHSGPAEKKQAHQGEDSEHKPVHRKHSEGQDPSKKQTKGKDLQKSGHHGEDSVHKPAKPDKDPGKRAKNSEHKPTLPDQDPGKKHSPLKSTQPGEDSKQDRNSVQKQALTGKGKDPVQKHGHGEDSVQKSSQPGRDPGKKHTNPSEGHQHGRNPGKQANPDEGHIPARKVKKDGDVGTKQHTNPSHSSQDLTKEPAHTGQQEDLVREDLDDLCEKMTQSSKQSSKGSGTTLSKGLLVNPSMLAKLMAKPKIPVFSCIKKKILSPDTFTNKAALTQYAMDLVAEIGKPSDPRIYLDFLVGKGDREPLLYITSEEDIAAAKESVFAISFRDLQDTNSSRYLRETYLNLRKFSDRVKVKKDTPLVRNGITSNGLYERYPFRRIVEGVDKPKKFSQAKK